MIKRTLKNKPALLLLLLGGLWLAAPGQATPLAGPGYNLDQLSFSVAAVVGFAWRDIHVIEDNDKGDDATSSRLGVRATFSPLWFLDVYGNIGTADWRMQEPGFDSVLGLLYGGGLRLRLFPWFWEEEGLFNLELDAQAMALSLRSGNASKHDFGHETADAELWEYQISLMASKTFQFLVPYGGICYDRLGVNFSPGGSQNIESDFHWGVFIGLDYFVTPMVFFSAELHIFSETSLYLGVGFAY